MLSATVDPCFTVTMSSVADLPKPLAERLRPRQLSDIHGQGHLLAPGKPLYRAIVSGQPHSMVLWGPPGTGKTTLAMLIARYCQADFITLSAVMAGVKDVRAAVDSAKQHWRAQQQRTVLFIDEVHRFNKAQQDAFLPHIEDGTLLFIGATTENPSFSLNNALLSRVRVYVLKSLTQDDLIAVIERALDELSLPLNSEQKKMLAQAADGDARRVLILLDLLTELVTAGETLEQALQAIMSEGLRRFDKGGDEFYDQISALHKAVRGSNPDAALYWLARMLDGGGDPYYIARRILRMASEDIGNADPRALQIALNAWQSFERLGSPEGDLALAQAVVYLACAAKSNAVYTAFKQAIHTVKNGGTLPVPEHLRNAPTALAKQMGHGKNYRYAHDEPGAFAAGATYFPNELGELEYYQPVERGLEIKIKQKLDYLRALNQSAAPKA